MKTVCDWCGFVIKDGDGHLIAHGVCQKCIDKAGGKMETVCPICGKWVSNWAVLTGHVIVVNETIYHEKCLKDKSIKEVVK